MIALNIMIVVLYYSDSCLSRIFHPPSVSMLSQEERFPPWWERISHAPKNPPTPPPGGRFPGSYLFRNQMRPEVNLHSMYPYPIVSRTKLVPTIIGTDSVKSSSTTSYFHLQKKTHIFFITPLNPLFVSRTASPSYATQIREIPLIEN